MKGGYLFVIFVSVSFLQISECADDQGYIEKLFTKTIEGVNQTTILLHSGFNGTVNLLFEPIEYIGGKVEDGIISATNNIGKLIGFIASKIKILAIKAQKGEKKLVKCVKSEQFDPVKDIFLDISTCVTGKADTISQIIQNSLVQVNSTYGILKSLTMLPQCEDAKCLADYTSGIFGKIGGIVLGLGSIGKDLTTGIAGIPVTLPMCLATKPALSPVKVFGLLGKNIIQCFLP